MHVEQRRARLDLVGRATTDGAAHVLSWEYRGPYPQSYVRKFATLNVYVEVMSISYMYKLYVEVCSRSYT